ncbi:hypothetical protein [uncultured Zoogloea sp.]|uniref:hypothetical protein n=1 Tax=uncultured Zoogloea sp. TaxID=160237 RepID=UPI002626D589|nr:hypothetical protein [uncultured Zoogloea sp.]
MYDFEPCRYAAREPYRYFDEVHPGVYRGGFRHDNETLFYLDFHTFVYISSSGGELRELTLQFRTRSCISLHTIDFLQQRTLSLQLSALPSYVQVYFNRLSKSEYVEYRTGLLSAIRAELAAHSVEFRGKK